MRFLIKIKHNYFILALFIIELILFFQNYQPNTFFLGWDNLFPELNSSENIKRSIFSIWQEYRGLGLLDGMSFAANLPHYIFINLLSIFLPQNLLRYFFIFLMHLLGGVGMYYLIYNLQFTIYNNKKTKLIAFLGALFYQYNLATVQMFFTIYELFAVHFAFLPWSILFLIKYLKTGFKKNLILFALVSFFAIPQAHVPTLFIVYALALFTLIVFYLFKEKKEGLKKVSIIVALTFLINSFWGLPYIYTAFTNAKTIANSKINQMSTEDIYLKNKAYGDFEDVVLMKGFSLDFIDSTKPFEKNDYMMLSWKKHIDSPIFVTIGFLFFGLTLFGSFVILRNRKREFYPFFALFVISFLMLGNDIPILGGIYNIFSNFLPFFFQIFRFTFTKFSILYAFSYSVLFAVGLSIFFDKLRKIKHLEKLIFPFFLLILSYYTFPSFQGQFLYKNLKLQIPFNYFNLVDFFKNQNKNERIALLPQTSFWGWTYTIWGYRGSGFIWYGLPQATMDGAFYPWSSQNENYYWEITQAIYSKNSVLLDSVLEKYQINWAVVDHSLTSPYSPQSQFMAKLEETVKNSEKLTFAERFGSIDVYKANLNTETNDYVFLADNLPVIGPKYQWNNLDYAYLENNNYIYDQSQKKEVYYPFRSLFTGRKQEELEFKVEDKGSYFSFLAKIPKDLAGAKLIIPKIFQEEVMEINKNDLEEKSLRLPQILLDNEAILMQIGIDEDSFLNASYPTVMDDSKREIFLPYINEGNLEVRVPKTEGYFSYNNNVASNLSSYSSDDCGQIFNKGGHKIDEIRNYDEKFIRLTSINSSNCLNFDLTNLSQRIGYLVGIKSKYVEGKNLLFSIINKSSQRPDFEVNLSKDTEFSTSYFVIPPMEQYSLGYNLFFNNSSIGKVKTANDLSKITVNPIPYRFLVSLKIVKQNDYRKIVKTSTEGINVNHQNPSLYSISISNEKIQQSNNPILILSQSYDEGWKAYQVQSSKFKVQSWINTIFPFIFGEEIKEHVLVNNWENGWKIQDSRFRIQDSRIVIVFWPQYLEFAGFGLLIISMIYVCFYKSFKLQ